MSTSTLKKQLQSDDNRCETSVDKLINKCKYHRNFQIYKYFLKFYKRKVGADKIK
jgi:hypothetical protein